MTASATSSGAPAGRRALRIVLVLGKSTGGIGTHVLDLARGLRTRGHEVIIVTDPLTARTFEIPDALALWPDPRHLDPRGLIAMRRILRSADIVHAHGHQAGALVAAVLPRTGRGGTGVILSLHNEPPTLSGPAAMIARRVQRTAVRAADLVTGASSDLVEQAARLGARRSQLACVPSPRVPGLLGTSPADREATRRRVRTAYGVGPQEPLIVTISRIAPQKDLGTLVDAAHRLTSAPAPAGGPAWLVAGSGIRDLTADLERRANGTGVRFIGPVTDPAALLLAADVFALTSTWEARALVVQEALAAGLPVVASAVGGMPDLLDGLGVLVPPRDPAAFADALASLLTDPGQRAAAGQRGRERAASWPDSAAMVSAWVADYVRVIEAVG